MALIGFDEYHMGTSVANPEAIGLSTLAGLLVTNGHTVETIREPLSLDKELPWDVVVLPFPKEEFKVDETMSLQNHLRSGKSVLLLAEWGDLFGHVEILNQLTSPFGITINKDRVTDHEQHLTQKVELGGVVLGEQSMPHYVKIRNFTKHQVTEGIRELHYFSGCSLGVSKPAVALAMTSGSSFGDIDLDSELSEGEEQGALCIAAASEMNGRLLVVGDSNVAANGYIDAADNLRFVVQAISWLSFAK